MPDTHHPSPSTQHPDADRVLLDQVWTYLDRHHRGRDRAVKQADLAAVMGLNPRVLHDACQRLTLEDERPIASTCRPPFGMYVAHTPEERADYAAQLEHRIIALARRLRAFTRAPFIKLLHQVEIFSGDSSAVQSAISNPQSPIGDRP